MPIKSDAQVQRTKSWMVNALLELMNSYDFSEITITQIARQAQLDRRTYYRHFKSKEEILSFHIQSLGNKYESLLLEKPDFSTKSIAMSFFTVCENNRDDLLRLHRHKLMPLLLYELDKLFLKYHKKFTPEVEGESDFFNETAYVMAFIVGGFCHMLEKWASDRMTKTPEELSEILLQFLPNEI